MERTSKSIKKEIEQNISLLVRTVTSVEEEDSCEKQNEPAHNALVSTAFEKWAELFKTFNEYREEATVVNKIENVINYRKLIKQGANTFPEAMLESLIRSLFTTSLIPNQAGKDEFYSKYFDAKISVLDDVFCDILARSGPKAFWDSSDSVAILPYLMASYILCAAKKATSERSGERHAKKPGYIRFFADLKSDSDMDNIKRFTKTYIDSFIYLDGYLDAFICSSHSRASTEVKAIKDSDKYKSYLQHPHIEGNSYKLKDYTKTDLQYEASFQALIYSFCVLACSKVDGLSEKVNYSESYKLFNSQTCAFETILSFKPHPNQEESIKDNEDGKKRINQAKAQLDEICTNPPEDEDELLTDLDYAEWNLSHEISKSAKFRVPLTIAQVLKKPSNVVDLLHSLSGDETEDNAVIKWANDVIKNKDPLSIIDQYLRVLFSENDDMLETIDILLNECKRDYRMESYTPEKYELLLNHRYYLEEFGIDFDQLQSEPAKGTDEWYIQAAFITVALLSPWGKTLNLMRFDALPIEGDDE